MFHVPEPHRVKQGLYASTKSDGNQGAFKFYYRGANVLCIASFGFEWEHVSVSIDNKKCPNWPTMCHVKDLFWDKTDTVLQFHPRIEEYVNNHPATLHLWREGGKNFKLPPSILTGIK